MESSKLKGYSFIDPFRGREVVATPEEIIRQKLLELMVEKLGFPKELITLEKQLSELPHLDGDVPQRRVDILCFAKGLHEDHALYPLLLIECKEGIVTKAAESQAMGYNHYVKAPFVAVCGKAGPSLIFPQKLSFLPTYKELVEHAC